MAALLVMVGIAAGVALLWLCHAPFANSLLRAAVYRSSARRVAMALRLGADPNRRFPDGLEPLSSAVACGDLAVVEALLHGGARVDDPAQKVSPLAHAVLLSRVEIVERLLDAGADCDRASTRGLGPLCNAVIAHATSRRELARLDAATACLVLLLQRGQIDPAGAELRAAIAMAAKLGDEAVLQHFASHGIDIDAIQCPAERAQMALATAAAWQMADEAMRRQAAEAPV